MKVFDTNFSTAVMGVFSGTLKTLNGSLGSEASVTLSVTFDISLLFFFREERRGEERRSEQRRRGERRDRGGEKYGGYCRRQLEHETQLRQEDSQGTSYQGMPHFSFGEFLATPSRIYHLVGIGSSADEVEVQLLDARKGGAELQCKRPCPCCPFWCGGGPKRAVI